MTMSNAGTRIRAALRDAAVRNRWIVPVIVAFALIWTPVNAQADELLGTAAGFAVLAGSTVTNTGGSVIQGDVGVSPGSAITGFPPGIVNGTVHAADAVAAQAHADLITAYNSLAGMASTSSLTDPNLGGLTLTAGVYSFASSAQLTGGLILDAGGDSNASFIFQIGSTLTTASLSSVTVINGGSDANVYWQVGSSATLGTGTAFKGSIVALTSITLTTGANIESGRALAINGAVTLDTNRISVPAAPEPGSLVLLIGGGVPLLGLAVRRRMHRQ